MKIIYIRFKNIATFGLVVLCVSFVWFAMTSFEWDRNMPITKADQEVADTSLVTEKPADLQAEETTVLPTVMIVPEEEKATEFNDDFFSEYRLERDRTRSEQVEILNEVINNPNSAAQTRLEAQQQLLLLTDNMGKEAKIEKAIIAKGFPEAVAVIQPQSAMVIVPTKGFREDEIARIADIVTKIANCRMEDVVIVPKTQ